MSDSAQTVEPVYRCPEGNEYREGEIIPVLHLGNASIYNTPVVRYTCPGYPGRVKVIIGIDIAEQPIVREIEHDPSIPDEGILEWTVDPMEGDHDSYYLAPRSQAWRLDYAERECARQRAEAIMQMKNTMGGDV